MPKTTPELAFYLLNLIAVGSVAAIAWFIRKELAAFREDIKSLFRSDRQHTAEIAAINARCDERHGRRAYDP